MDFVKLKEILETIKVLDPHSKESIINALNIAEHIESSSMDFYKKESTKTQNGELHPFFVFLVKEEEMHLAKILELRKLLEQSQGPLKHEIKFTNNKPPGIHAIPAGQQEMTAVLYALWREKKAVEFYSDAEDKTLGAVKKFFGELAEFEKGHVALLEKIVEESQNTDELIMG
ncbi:MAG: ferritin family protein [archaeon]|jgi:rubrerythrin